MLPFQGIAQDVVVVQKQSTAAPVRQDESASWKRQRDAFALRYGNVPQPAPQRHPTDVPADKNIFNEWPPEKQCADAASFITLTAYENAQKHMNPTDSMHAIVDHIWGQWDNRDKPTGDGAQVTAAYDKEFAKAVVNLVDPTVTNASVNRFFDPAVAKKNNTKQCVDSMHYVLHRLRQTPH